MWQIMHMAAPIESGANNGDSETKLPGGTGSATVAAARIAGKAQVAAARVQATGVQEQARTQAVAVILAALASGGLAWLLKPNSQAAPPTAPTPTMARAPAGTPVDLTVIAASDVVTDEAVLPYVFFLQQDCAPGAVVAARSADLKPGAGAFKLKVDARPYQISGYFVLAPRDRFGHTLLHHQEPDPRAEFDVPLVSADSRIVAILCVTHSEDVKRPYPGAFKAAVLP